ncbi:phage antirepressor KilAC domain-containing protein [Nostoc sp. NMS4]|uniref:phage antirepressor KilAC domain-containing protein n=1 Tax=Nostoc sp. NMS4 TaxID=2815390 RepID=UPI0025D08422|nr:phage antirepressor KilAC domain-containing protein [Nostoc sp. NMS4]MBN3927124.1 phage antirepressor KilAC domain-containing protein [Nostoc sp. NMS4]
MTNLNISIQSQIKATVESEVEFSVNFDDGWQWLDYSKKANAKASFLNCGFVEEVDYIVLLDNQQNLSGGRPCENIYLTKDCLKGWAMMSNTSRGKEVRAYFIKCEKELKELKSLPAKPVDIVFMLEQAATAIKEARALAAIAEEKVVYLTPKAEVYDIIAEAGDNLKVGEVAKLLGVANMGPNRLFDFLRKQEVLMKNNEPYSRYEFDSNYFTCIRGVKNGFSYVTTLVTPKGVDYIIRLLQKNGHYVPSKLAA